MSRVELDTESTSQLLVLLRLRVASEISLNDGAFVVSCAPGGLRKLSLADGGRINDDPESHTTIQKVLRNRKSATR